MYGRAAFIHYSRWWLRVGRWLLLATVLAGCGYAHWRISETALSGERMATDELEYRSLLLTVETRPDLSPDLTRGVSGPLQDWFPHRTDGVINPLFPWLAAWQVKESHDLGSPDALSADDQRAILSGQIMMAALLFAFIAVLAIACARVLSLPGTLVVTMLCGWGALFPEVRQFTPEALFSVLFLIAWVGCLLAMARNSLWAYAIVGVSSGLAYMANESVQLLVVVFILVTSLRWLWGWIAAHWPGRHSTSLWVVRNHFMGLFLLVALHLLVIGPRLSYAYERFDDPFFSIKRQIMWLDSPAAARAWMSRAQEKEERTALDPAPSWTLYAASHTQPQMWQRLEEGFSRQWQAFLRPSHLEDAPVARARGLWLLALLAVLAALGMVLASLRREPNHAGQRLHPESATMTLFVLAAAAAYALAGAWGTPLGTGTGFAGALLAPLTLSIVWACESLLRRARRRHASHRVFLAYEAVLVVLTIAMAWQVMEVLQAAPFGT